MTAHATQGYREKCLEGGMDDYISKPIRVEVLKNVLEAFLGKDNCSPQTLAAHSQTEESSNTKRKRDIEQCTEVKFPCLSSD